MCDEINTLKYRLNNDQKKMIIDMMTEGYLNYLSYWENDRWQEDGRTEENAIDDEEFAGYMLKIMEEVLE